MQGYLCRELEQNVGVMLGQFPVVALLGPRQCGKSTLAKLILSQVESSLYLDLESPADFAKLQDPEAFFEANRERLICIDEVQRYPQLFAVLRSVVDRNPRNGQFLLLGSASRELLAQSSETLAGRIYYLELTPFQVREIPGAAEQLTTLWGRGGFPRSFLAKDDRASYSWRRAFIQTYLERDIPQFGIKIPSRKIERFWRMCAHSHGQLFNASKLGGALEMTHHSVRSYLDILDQTFMMRVLMPFEINLKKRLVKSPKIYVRDTGILHALLQIESRDDLFGHPVYGLSWESFVLESIMNAYPDWQATFYRTATGSELDLILQKGQKIIAIECKSSSSPVLARGNVEAINSLPLKACFVVAPVASEYPIRENVWVTSLSEVLVRIGEI